MDPVSFSKASSSKISDSTAGILGTHAIRRRIAGGRSSITSARLAPVFENEVTDDE